MRRLFNVLLFISVFQLAGCESCPWVHPTEPSQVRWNDRFQTDEIYYYGEIIENPNKSGKFEYFEGKTRSEVLNALNAALEANGYVVCNRTKHRQIYKQWGTPCAGCVYSNFDNGYIFAGKIVVWNGERISSDVSFVVADTQDGNGVWVVAYPTGATEGDVEKIFRQAKFGL